MERIFFEITIIICLAAVLTALFRHFKQPAILAYILTGIILGPLGLFNLHEKEALETLGQLGITLLLFILGLELKLYELRTIGKAAVLAGCTQMLLTVGFGFFVVSALGFSPIASLYTAIALAFSSTIVIVKILSDKKDLKSLHGKLAIGILLMQDFFAVMTIVFLTGVSGASGPMVFTQILLIILKVIVVFGWILVMSMYVFPRVVRRIARSDESLFLFSLAWVFSLTAFLSSPFIGFSIEIGGFLAGLALANSAENFQIIARMRTLRDFFITIFFVVLGLQMSLAGISKIFFPAILLTLFVVIMKPLIVMGITGVLGYKLRTSFFVGLSLSQVSEFSFLLLFLGASKGVVPSDVTMVVLLVGIISFATSTYLMQNSNHLYNSWRKYLHFFEKKHTHADHLEENDDFSDLRDHVILVGADEMGVNILRTLEDTKQEVVVVDFDPDTVHRLKKDGVKIMFGDISDADIQERVHFDKAKLVISTVPDLEDNVILIKGLNKENKKAKVVVIAYDASDTKELYRTGADYVVMPHLAGGRHLAKLLIDKNHLELIEKYKEKDLSDIR